MEDIQKIFKSCSRCNGSGEESTIGVDGEGDPVNGAKDCPACSGTGIRIRGYLDETLIDLLNDMNDGISNSNGVFDSYLVL